MKKSLAWLALLCVAIFAQEPAEPTPEVVPEPAPAVVPEVVPEPTPIVVPEPAPVVAPEPIPTNIPASAAKECGSSDKTLKIVVSSVLLAGGLGAIAFGIAQDKEVSNFIDQRNGKDASDAARKRDMSYGMGAALLASGLTFVIFF
jgi:hypothetical protein